MKVKRAYILTGGKGTRLKKRLSDKPKILAEIKNKPFIDYQINWLIDQGIKECFFLTKYKSNQIENYIKKNQYKYKAKLFFIKEEEFLGTGGAIKNAIKKQSIKNHFLVVNGDTYFNIKKINNFIKFHLNNKNLLTIGCSYKNKAERYGSIVEKKGRLLSINKNQNNIKRGLVFSGIFIISPKLIKLYKKNKFQIENFFEYIATYKSYANIYKFKSNNFFYDYGTIKSYDLIKKTGFYKGK